MKYIFTFLGTVAVLAMVFLASGCGDSETTATQNEAPKIVSVYPADGAADVYTASAISMKFSQPMDTSSVRIGFHMAGGDVMNQWMDSLNNYMGMGHMGMNNMDHMMDWMNNSEYGGHFEWNHELDSCRFIPDSIMAPNTNYMIYMRGDIKSRGGMMMNMSGTDYDGYMYHFHTAQD